MRKYLTQAVKTSTDRKFATVLSKMRESLVTVVMLTGLSLFSMHAILLLWAHTHSFLQ